MSGLPEPYRFPLLPPSSGRFASLRAARGSNSKLLEWNELLAFIAANSGFFREFSLRAGKWAAALTSGGLVHKLRCGILKEYRDEAEPASG